MRCKLLGPMPGRQIGDTLDLTLGADGRYRTVSGYWIDRAAFDADWRFLDNATTDDRFFSVTADGATRSFIGVDRTTRDALIAAGNFFLSNAAASRAAVTVQDLLRVRAKV